MFLHNLLYFETPHTLPELPVTHSFLLLQIISEYYPISSDPLAHKHIKH